LNEEKMNVEEFDRLFDEICNWGRWGSEDQKGTLNFLTPAIVAKASGLIRSGKSVSMARPIDTVASADNPGPAIHHMTRGYDILPENEADVQFVADYLGCACHGWAHSHFDALCHVAYRGKLYNDRPLSLVNSQGARSMDITQYSHGIVGRGVLLDIPRLRNVKWLEPGEAVTAEELEAAEKAEGVKLGEGDVFVFRVGHYKRRVELGPWDVDGEGRAGLHPTAMKLLHERKIAAFFPDGDGEVVPTPVPPISNPVHALQITSMGLACADSLQLEELAKMCEDEGRWEFMAVVSTLRLRGGTGSLVNPIAIF
jgi:kynurenine formamidase